MSTGAFKYLPPEAHALGAPLAFYPEKGREINFVQVGCALLFLFLFGILLILLPFLDAQIREDYPFGPILVGSGLVLFCFVMVGLALWFTSGPRKSLGVFSFSNGLAWKHKNRVDLIPFDEIESVWNIGSRFRTRNGQVFEWPESLEGSTLLADLVMRETLPRLTEHINAALAAGESVAFGPLLIGRDEVVFADQSLAWKDIIFIFEEAERLYFIHRGDVVHRDGGRIRVVSSEGDRPRPSLRVMKLPNKHVLWPLLERLRPGTLEHKLAPAEKKPSAAVIASSIPRDESPESVSAREGISEQRDVNPARQEQQAEQAHEERLATLSEETRGPLIAVYRVPFGVISGSLFQFFFLIPLGFAPLAVGIFIQWMNRVWFNVCCSCLIIMGAVLTLLFVFAFLYCLRELFTRIELFRAGIFYSRGLIRFFCRWEDMREGRWLWWGRDTSSGRGFNYSVGYEILTSTGERLKFNVNLDQFYELVGHFEKETRERWLLGLVERFYAGEAIQFASYYGRDVIVSREGVKGDNLALDWNEITGVQLKDHCIWFTKRGSWSLWNGAKLDRLSNPHLIVPLVEEILRRRHWEQNESTIESEEFSDRQLPPAE